MESRGQHRQRKLLGAGFVLAAASAAGALAVWGGLRWPHLHPPPAAASDFPFGSLPASPPAPEAWTEMFKLVAAAAVGMLVTAVNRRCRRDKPLSRSLQQAQILLCVSGAIVMMIIGNSVARALSIAGAAAIVRFRTPVKDPKESVLLFLLLGLGMCCGLGAFAVVGPATLFLCVFLWLLDRIGEPERRTMTVELVAAGEEFPAAHVERVFAHHGVAFEARQFSQSGQLSATYRARLAPGASLETLSSQLLGGGASGIKSVAWERA